VTDAKTRGHADTGRGEIFIVRCRKGGTLQYYLRHRFPVSFL